VSARDVSKFALIAVLALAAAVSAPVGARAASGSPMNVVEALHTAINVHDIDLGLEAFAEDAVVIQPRIGGLPQVYVGRQEIRWWLRAQAAQHAQWTLLSEPEMVGDQVRFSHALGIDAFRDKGFETVTVDSDIVIDEDGRIRSLRTVLTPEAARGLQRAPGPASVGAPQLPLLTDAMTSTVLVGVGIGIGAATAVVLSRRRQRALSVVDNLLATGG
jgi:hypothetical protein